VQEGDQQGASRVRCRLLHKRLDHPSAHPLAVPAPIPAGRTNVAAVVSLIFGILWLFWLGSVVAVVCGHVARAQMRRSGEAGDGAAIAGLILGYLGLVTLGLWFVFVVVFGVAAVSVSG